MAVRDFKYWIKQLHLINDKIDGLEGQKKAILRILVDRNVEIVDDSDYLDAALSHSADRDFT
jgi:hypothetical protein